MTRPGVAIYVEMYSIVFHILIGSGFQMVSRTAHMD